jgi:predicted AlkP superfamily phosphohydrolase/phosphomutase
MEKIPDDAAIPINWQGFSFKLAPLLQDLGLLFTTADGEIDWTRTRAYPVMTGGPDFGISFNLKAREEHGIVSYSELIQLRENIVKELQNIILKFNEKPLFGVVARGNLKGGEPDIILDRLAAIKYGDIKKVLESTMIIGGREIPVTTFIEDKNVSGLHGKVNPQADYVLGKRGIILISGSGIKRNNVISGMKDVDVSPTILYLAGIPAGNYMDGEVFTSMCTEEFKKTHPVERVQKFPEVYFEIKNDPSGKKEKNPKQYSMK